MKFVTQLACIRRVATVLGCLSLVGVTWAHEPGLSSAVVRLFSDKLEAQLTFALKDAHDLAGLDGNQDGEISEEEFAAGQERLGKLVADAFEVHFDDTPAHASDIRCQMDENNNADVFLIIPGHKFSRLTIRSKMIADLRLDHRQYFLLQNPGGIVLAERLLGASSDTVKIHVDPETADSLFDEAPYTDTPATVAEAQSSFRQFLVLGIEHILVGYDHLLFLLALLIVARDWLSSLKIITCFTIAHSITLALATFELVQVGGRWVEPLIAVSIAYVGLENIWRRGDPHGRWRLTFAFGLIHGFGFASVLQDMNVAARPGGVAMPLFAFNLGVEVGQIIIAAVVLPIFWKLRTHPVFVARWIPVCSAIVALAGAWWFIERVWLG
ncbi:MAG: HupE/UreJ family protein [Verrucomicrobiae bacterium]|nr:HupE/UreJ family protein [Verrucomicrobiae bacterium]